MSELATMAEAVDWQLRQPALDEQGWEAFVRWLEASPANARAFDRVAAADRIVAAIPVSAGPYAANDDHPPVAAVVAIDPGARRRRAWRSLAVAGAVAAGIVALVVPLASGPHSYSVETAPGESRRIALGDGSAVVMAGASRMTLDHADPRVASLDRGEAMFVIRHDSAHPFVLTAGAATITDLGTQFDVTRGASRTDVAVARGSVRFGQAGASAVMGAGDTLAAHDGSARFATGRTAPASVGGWRTGRLSFAGQPMTVVAAALTRHYGTPITLAGRLPDQPFTGMFRVTGSADRDIPHLAALIGASARRDGKRWTVSSGATR